MNVVQVDIKKIQKHKAQLIKTLKPLLFEKKVVFFDVPVHGNVGDSLIFLGTLKLLRLLNTDILDCVSAYEPRRLMENHYSEDTVYVFQGGGNFGDIYQINQSMRISTIRKYTKNRVIIFLQSMHYSDQEQMNKELEIMSNHDDLHVLVRDVESFKNLENSKINNRYLTPDIASMVVDDFANAVDANKDRLFFKIKDVAATGGNDSESVNWVDITPKSKAILITIVNKLVKYNNRLNISKLTYRLVEMLHKILAKSDIPYFSQYKIVQTDRLHGMILSQLLGLKTEALDNSYGKLIRYSTKWYNEENSKIE